MLYSRSRKTGILVLALTSHTESRDVKKLVRNLQDRSGLYHTAFNIIKSEELSVYLAMVY